MWETLGSNKDIHTSLEAQRDAEIGAVLDETKLREQDLQKDAQRNAMYLKFYKKFHLYDETKINESWINFVNKLKERFTDSNSIEYVLFNNPQIQKLLINILWDQKSEWEWMKRKYEEGLAKLVSDNNSSDVTTNSKDANQTNSEWKEDKESIIDTFEEFMFKEWTPENFEEFLCSDEGISTLINILQSHIDVNTWEMYPNYPISETMLRIELHQSWKNNMHMKYNKENEIYTHEEQNNIKSMWVLLKTWVKGIIWEYLKEWWQDFDKWLITSLENLISDSWEEGVSLVELLKDETYKDNLQSLLKDNIGKFASLVLDKNRKSLNLNTWDKEVDMLLKSYLYIYWKCFYPELFNKNLSSSRLNDLLYNTMGTILASDDEKLLSLIKDKRMLDAEKRREKERQLRDRKRREAAAKRNREKNSNIHSRESSRDPIELPHAKSWDLDSASGAEIAAEANLWKDLNNFKVNTWSPENENWWTNEAAFDNAWGKFINKHDEIKAIITKDQMHSLFNLESKTISENSWHEFVVNNDAFRWLSNKEIESYFNTIKTFSFEYEDNLENLISNSNEKKKSIDETVRTYAAGAVIDNIRDIFADISEKFWWEVWSKWFKLNQKEPIKKDWDNLLISGEFNWAEIKVRYNLDTGELFMNSFFQRTSPTKISIGNSDNIDYPIWQIDSFKDILNNYYKAPRLTTSHKRWSHDNEGGISNKKKDITSKLNSQIDLIGEAVVLWTEKQSSKNSAIEQFMKTFNIIRSDEWFGTLDFNQWSNLYDFINIVDNNTDNQALEYFNNTFMPKIMEKSWLQWWENNLHQDKNSEESRRTFSDDEWENKSIQYLRSKIENFNPDQFKWNANFDASHQLSFVDVIKEKVIDPTSWNLNISNMESFIIELDKEDSESNGDIESSPEDELARNLDVIF